MSSSKPMEYVKEMVIAEKSAGERLASSSVFMVIKGAEELTLSITTGSLPVVKNNQIEYSSPTGLKMAGLGKNQSKNDLSITLHERDTLMAKKAIENIQVSGRNGSLDVEFWTGDGELVKSRLYGTLIAGQIVTEDNPEFDAEGTETPMSRTFTLVGHYFPEDCTVDEATRGIAGTMIDKLKEIDGLMEC